MHMAWRRADRTRGGWRAAVAGLALVVGPVLTAPPAWGAVSVSRAELSGTSLRPYTLQVGTSTAFTTLVLERTTTASQLSAVLPTQGDRSWRVRAHRPDGSAGAWSAARSLRVKS